MVEIKSSVFKNTRCLITGPMGFVGTHLLATLKHQGAVLYLLDRDFKNLSDEWRQDSSVHCFEGNLGDTFFVQKVFAEHSFEYVFHLGGMSLVDLCDLHPADCFSSNIQGTINVLNACCDLPSLKGIMCIDSVRSLEASGRAYDLSKKAAHMVAQAFVRDHNLPLFSLCSPQIYGPRDSNLSRLIPRTILTLCQGKNPVVYEDVRDRLHDFVYVDDVVNMMVIFMEKIEFLQGKTVLIGTGTPHTIADIVNHLCVKMGTHFRVESGKAVLGTQGDLSLMHELIPHYEQCSFEKGLDQCIEWYTDLFRHKFS